MSEKEILNAIIIGYREVVKERYNYKNLKEKYQIPPSFDEHKTEQFKTYFLEHIYPNPTKRAELDAAFQSLDGYISHPEKLLRILIDSGSLIFKYGRHLPKILSAGIKALKSFRTANILEKKLVENALIADKKPPFSTSDIQQLLKRLSPKEVMDFLESSQLLFETLHDKKLVGKITEIVDYLIAKMEKRPTIYSSEEIKALKLGKNLIAEGAALFYQLPEADQKGVLDLVVRIERDALEAVFS